MPKVNSILISPNPALDVLEYFSAHGLHLASAESCTGGLVGTLMTAIPGSSAVYAGGFVTYTNQMKIDLLGVAPALIGQYTEVSSPVAKAMAEGARARTGAEIAVSLTGVAGPGGGSEQTPVGTVYIGVSTPRGTVGERFSAPVGANREQVRQAAAVRAMCLLLEQMDA